jgi:hypothetical protein
MDRLEQIQQVKKILDKLSKDFEIEIIWYPKEIVRRKIKLIVRKIKK